MDGVNNGTQHLAAMSLDEKAGKLVGLIPMKIPKDFYLVMGKQILELNQDTEIGSKMKHIPMKLIRKGISKRGSMTRVIPDAYKPASSTQDLICALATGDS